MQQLTALPEAAVWQFLGAFLLAAACGAVGAAGGVFVAREVDERDPTDSLRRTAALGAALGLTYPVGWIVAVDVVERLGGPASGPVAGGVPAVVAAGGFSGLFLLAARSLDVVTTGNGSHVVGRVVLSVTFGVVLAVAFSNLLPLLFPVFQ